MNAVPAAAAAAPTTPTRPTRASAHPSVKEKRDESNRGSRLDVHHHISPPPAMGPVAPSNQVIPTAIPQTP